MSVFALAFDSFNRNFSCADIRFVQIMCVIVESNLNQIICVYCAM